MSSFYQDKGSLPAGAPSYVVRPADEQVMALCRAGGLAYILAPRQTGKSSLVVRARQRLADEGLPSVYIDLTAIGSEDVTAEQWYLSLLSEIGDQLGLDLDIVEWWRARQHLTPVKRLVDLLQREVVGRIDGHVALFIDEIDSTLRLPFSPDDFFAALRSVHNARAVDPALGRLAIVLLGVAAPSDLIADPRRTPFNVGEAIDLGDLSPDAARVLAGGLADASDPSRVLVRVLHWTDGHPRLTQHLCASVASRDEPTQDDVDAAVAETLLGPAGESDETLKGVRRQAERDPRARSWLPLYRAVLRQEKKAPAVDWTDDAQLRARLVGLVKGAPGEKLRPRNRVYAEVFDRSWVRSRLRMDPARRLALFAIAALVLVTLAAGGWFLYDRLTERDRLLEQVRSGGPELALLALHRLHTDHGFEPDELAPHLTEQDRNALLELFDRTAPKLPEGEGAPAILTAVRVAYPHITGPETTDLEMVGAMLAGLDAYPGRDPTLAADAQALREELLAPLRARRPPPDLDGLDWVDVPAGTFTMGSPEAEVGRYEWEGPQHRVTLSPFRMLRHEVTNAQYRQFVPDHQAEEPSEWPVTLVSWYQATVFAAWLGVRLPSEAKWEYAARAGTTGPRHGVLDEVAWHYENTGASPEPVMRKNPNAWDLYDMLGNAFEWCADWYGAYAAPAQTDPTGPEGGVVRVLRGGSWVVSARWLRSAGRSGGDPGSRSWFVGFRVVRPAPEP